MPKYDVNGHSLFGFPTSLTPLPSAPLPSASCSHFPRVVTLLRALEFPLSARARLHSCTNFSHGQSFSFLLRHDISVQSEWQGAGFGFHYCWLVRCTVMVRRPMEVAAGVDYHWRMGGMEVFCHSSAPISMQMARAARGSTDRCVFRSNE